VVLGTNEAKLLSKAVGMTINGTLLTSPRQ